MMAQFPLSGLKVVELAEDPAGEMTGYLLALSGAEVLKIEPSEGAPSRTVGPFRRGYEGDREESLNFWYYNSNKKSVVRDIAAPDDLEPLLSEADILVTTWQPGELGRRQLDFSALSRRFPRLIILSITAFGLTGPWRDYRSSELVGLAAGGPLHMCGYDDHGLPPVLPGGNQAWHIAASFAMKAVMVALLDRQRSDRGQVVDVSMHEACAVTVELANPYWFYPKALVKRQTCRHAQPTATQSALFECADGRFVYFALILAEPKPWSALIRWMDEYGMAAHLSDPRFEQFAYRQQNYPDVQTVVECFFLIHDAETVFKEGQKRGLPIAIVTSPEELLVDEHEQAREFFVTVDHGEAGPVRYPGPPFRFSHLETVPRRRAPRLGEHDAEIDG